MRYFEVMVPQSFILRLKMPKYNFIEQEPISDSLGDFTRDVVRVEWRKGESELDRFERCFFISESEKQFEIRNCNRSLIFVDRAGKRLMSKLHIGDLIIRNPHVEQWDVKGVGGARVDLHEFDIKYAQQRREELERWREPAYRNELRQRYTHYTWYSVPYRLRQLDISPGGLEERIGHMQDLIALLGTRNDRTFISDGAREMEQEAENLVGLMDKKIGSEEVGQPARRNKGKQKIIVAPDIVALTRRVYGVLTDILGFVEAHSLLDKEKAYRYWQEVDAWEDIRDYNFVKYDDGFIEHLLRHFTREETAGSVFLAHFKTPIQVINFAFDKLKEHGYNGKRTVVEVDLEGVIGLDGVIALDDLPSDAKVKKTMRDGKYEVNVVLGVRKTPTRHLVITAGPLGDTGKHGFTSIYPGEYGPSLDDRDYWAKHAFIV